MNTVTIAAVILLILLSEIWNVVGQIFFKKGLNHMTFEKIRGVNGYLRYFKDALSDKFVWIGLGFQILCVVTWLLALAQADLSFVFPLGSVQYILVLLGAHFFLGEKIDRMKLIGTLLVVGGIVLIAFS